MTAGVIRRPGSGAPTRWSLPISAAASLGLMVGGLLVSGLIGGIFPSPYESPAVVAEYFSHQSSAVRLQSPFLVGSAVALAGCSALLGARMSQIRQSRSAQLALTASLLSAMMLALSGVSAWVLARGAERGFSPDVQTLHDLTFATGGVGHVVFLAMMVASVAIGSPGLLPTAMVRSGKVIGALGAVALVGLVMPGLTVLLPVVRFPGLVWLILAAALIARADRDTGYRAGEVT